MERTQLTPEWRQPIITVPLTQAFPELGQVKEFRSKKCIFNHDRTKLFNVVSTKYAAIDHAHAVDTIASALEEAFGEKAECNVRSLASGARIRAEFKLPFINPIEIRKNDLVNLTLVVRNAHDGMWKFSAMLGAFRLVCSNGMMIGQKFGSVSGKHFPQMGRPDNFAERLKGMIARGALLQDVWREWEDTPIKFEQAKEMLEGKFPDKYLARVLDSSHFPRSKWALYNDLTAFATHDTRSVNRRIEFDDSISAMFYKDLALPAPPEELGVE